jgi:hypothetical protein
MAKANPATSPESDSANARPLANEAITLKRTVAEN